MDYPERIGIISDLHCSSRWGLLSPRNETYNQSPGQKYLHDCLMWLARQETGGMMERHLCVECELHFMDNCAKHRCGVPKTSLVTGREFNPLCDDVKVSALCDSFEKKDQNVGTSE